VCGGNNRKSRGYIDRWECIYICFQLNLDMRDSPYEHTVKSHYRRGRKVNSYDRGSGDPKPHKISSNILRGSKLKNLNRSLVNQIHQSRSRNAQILDNSLRAPLTRDYKEWIHAPNEVDILGLDTPGDNLKASGVKNYKKYTNAQINMNQIGGIYRVDVWDKEGNIHNEEILFTSKDEAQKFVTKVKKANPYGGVNASYNMATGWLRIVFDEKPSRETLNKLKSEGFRYRPRSRAWTAKQNTTREALIESMAGKVEEVNISVNNEKKADFYNQKADKLREESKERYGKAKQLSDFIPIGQPILVGHHSERKHRSDLNKIDKNYKKSFELGDQAKKAQATADRYQAKAEGKENPVTILNRIEKLEKDIKKLESYKSEESKRLLPRANERLRQEREKYKRSGGVAADKITFKVGMKIQTSNGPALIKKVSKKSLRVKLITDNRNLQGPPWNNLKIDIKKVRAVL